MLPSPCALLAVGFLLLIVRENLIFAVVLTGWLTIAGSRVERTLLSNSPFPLHRFSKQLRRCIHAFVFARTLLSFILHPMLSSTAHRSQHAISKFLFICLHFTRFAHVCMTICSTLRQTAEFTTQSHHRGFHCDDDSVIRRKASAKYVIVDEKYTVEKSSRLQFYS